MKPIVLDFETHSISDAPRPHAPKPVGLAYQLPSGETAYAAWGHPINNGIYFLRRGKLTKATGTDPKLLARAVYTDALKHKGGCLGHNIAKFDHAVAAEHFGLKLPAWDQTHDTLFSLFLREPHASSLSLKPSAERLLGEPPEERDAVFDWLAAQGIIQKPKMKNGVITYQKDAGAYICKAPGDLVARYAIGDVTRTLSLHEMLLPEITQMDMLPAYDRERELAPILYANEQEGMRVDIPALERDTKIYEKALLKVDAWLRKELKAPGLNLDSDADAAAALKRSGQVTAFTKTPTGRDSVSKKVLTFDLFRDRRVWTGLYYRNALATVLTMSMRPWLEQATQTGGYIYTEWNQVRQSHGRDGFKGARSGRITCSYFQNITKDFMDRGDGYKEAWEEGDLKFLNLPPLPLVRVYLLPDEGEVFGHSDVDQQELKMVAHYEEGALAEEYRRDPKTDIHNFVQQLVKRVSGKDYGRRPIKIVDFRTVYGGGVSGLAEQLHIPYKEAAEIISNWKKALPDVVALDQELKQRFREGQHIRTLGGRVYHCKPPAIAKKGPRKGQLIHFEYTALNYLIQPSAADQTKQAIINYHKHPKRRARMVVTVHDEINISAPAGRVKEELKILQDCMVGAFTLDVPTTTTLKAGPAWGKLEKITLNKEKAA